MHYNLPNRRDLIVGTLFKFLSKTMVLILLLVRVVVEWGLCEINNAERRLCENLRKEELVYLCIVMADHKCASLEWKQAFISSLLFSNSVVASNIAGISQFCWKSIYDFLPVMFCLYICILKAFSLIMFIIDQYFFFCNF